MGLSASSIKGSATYFLAPAQTRISNYPELDSNVEAASLTDTPLGKNACVPSPH